MKKMLKRLNSKKGFTLAELLIVVAIIAVLVAVSIPVFTSQLNKSRQATDLANVRAAYAEAVATALQKGETNDDGKLVVTFNAQAAATNGSVVTVSDNTISVKYKNEKASTFTIDDDVVLSGGTSGGSGGTETGGTGTNG